MEQAVRVVKELVKDEIEAGKIELREIEGMTIENRVAKWKVFHLMYSKRSKM